MKRLAAVFLGLVAVGAVALSVAPAPPPPPPDRPRIIIPVPVRPLPPRKPRCPNCPEGAAGLPSLTELLAAQVGGRVGPDRVPLSVDYPATRHLENLRGSDGLGLCVYAANAMALDWHGDEGGRELLTFMTGRPGGGTPTKFDKDYAAFCESRGCKPRRYLHYEGSDLSVLDNAVSAGRMVGGTYYRSPTGRYRGERISHMVDWVHADGQRYCVLDNNHTGDRSYEWMSRQEAEKCIKDDRGRFWLVIWLDPTPPPPPHNPKESA